MLLVTQVHCCGRLVPGVAGAPPCAISCHGQLMAAAAVVVVLVVVVVVVVLVVVDVVVAVVAL